MKPTYRILASATLLLGAIALVSCTSTAMSPEDRVTARAELFDHVSSALSTTSVMAIKGTYGASCTARTGAWTIALNGYVMLTGETPLTVVSGDVGCALSVTEVKAGAVASSQSFKPAAPIVLAADYAAVGVPFMLAGAGPIQFYANFRLQPDLAFNSDFVMQMVYSDTVSETDLNTISNYAVTIATATAAAVPAPNATLALTGLVIKVDSHAVVKSATGTAVLKQGNVVAQTYVIDLDTVGAPPTYATLDTAYSLPANVRVAMTGATSTIAADDFSLVGLDLTVAKKRNVIVVNTLDGVRSYQVFQITFSKP